jgi:hypothetical protein
MKRLISWIEELMSCNGDNIGSEYDDDIEWKIIWRVIDIVVNIHIDTSQMINWFELNNESCK